MGTPIFKTYCRIYCVDVVPVLLQVRLLTSDWAVRSALKLITVLPSELTVQVPRVDEYQSPAVRGRGQHSMKGNDVYYTKACCSCRILLNCDKNIHFCSHTVAYNPNARRAYEKSQHVEDFGRIKLICSFNSLLQSHISA